MGDDFEMGVWYPFTDYADRQKDRQMERQTGRGRLTD